MAKRKHSDAIPATNSPAPEATPVPSQEIATTTAESQTPPVTEATEPTQTKRLFRVTLPAQPARVVEAGSPEEAWMAYKELMGITASVHKPDIVEA